jgi:hypothetical protein
LILQLTLPFAAKLVNFVVEKTKPTAFFVQEVSKIDVIGITARNPARNRGGDYFDHQVHEDAKKSV